ncbi:MAG TPA: 2Fe-2S iron-sulfur cluster-binding protein, partial [Methylomirabilota bacterium]
MELLISRFDPSRDDSLREQHYEITERPDWSVLDALNHIKDDIDPTLTFRWSCRMEICGSCGMMIDGEPRLACSTFLRDFQSPLRIAPLAHFPVIRDLVIEYDGFLDRLRTVKPWIIRAKESAAREGP